jgi:hypothetical protein
MAALEVLGTADVLTHFARGHPELLQNLRLVSPVLHPAVHQAALAVVAEAKTSFERLLQELPIVRVAELRELDYTYGMDLSEDEDDGESGNWQCAAMSYDEANRQLHEHQAVILRAQTLLEWELWYIGFDAQARALMHAGALSLLDCAWDEDLLLESIGVDNLPEFDLEILNLTEWGAGELWRNGTIKDLVDDEQEAADLRDMRARFGLESPRFNGFMTRSWLSATVGVAARERAGLAAPPGCYTLEQLVSEAPGVLDRARKAEWRKRHRADASQRRASWLARGLQQLGLGLEPDYYNYTLLRDCRANFELMGEKVAETLRSAVYLNWLHYHTDDKYKRAVDQLAKSSLHGDDCFCVDRAGKTGVHLYSGVGGWAATVLLQSKPEFQMPANIPWLPAPGNQTDKAVSEATRAVRARILWGRAFLRVHAIVALCRPSSAALTR